jgi:DNA-cytosine methyltransferase
VGEEATMSLSVGSLFAGIGGFDAGFARAGHRCVWQVEIDEQARGVLARHFPDAERFADVRDCGAHNLAPVDVITAGFPCQDVSVAGQRAGLAGARSGLFSEIVRIVEEMRESTGGLCPNYVVLENVPGLLSSHGGRDFAVVLGELAGLGAVDIGWRVCDAQYWAVAQRRRRVFVVASFTDRRSTAEILSLSSGGSWHTPPRREAGEGAAHSLAPSLTGSGRGVGRTGESRGQDPVIPVAFGGNNTSGPIDIAARLNAKGGSGRMDF